jgi:hypothetical protein
MHRRKKMTSVAAKYDGVVFRPTSPVDLEPDTDVMLTVHPRASTSAPRPSGTTGAKSFIDTALSLSGEGPSDWSQRVDHYLYGEMVDDGEG